MYQFQNEEIEKIIKNEPDENFIITGRRINGFFENAAVTCDNSANNLRFTMTDTFDGVPLWDKEIKIIYQTPDGYTDFAYPHSLSRENGIMTFSWLLSENVARVAGNVTFAIRISGEGFVWNSLPGCFKVSQGIIETGEAIPEYAAEWIETLDRKLAGMPEDIEENKTKITGVDEKLVLHLADKNNPHFVTKKQIGLENVDNTSDVDKPISVPVQNALEGKTDKNDFENHSGNADIHVSNTEKNGWNDKYSKQESDEKLSLKENIANKSAVIDGDSDDTKYPTAKAVKDYIELNRAKVDAQMSAISENAVQNKVISENVVNALRCSASGNPIKISDVSPIEHQIKVSVSEGGATVKRRGKNLFDYKSWVEYCNNEGGQGGSETVEYLGEECFSYLNYYKTTDAVFVLDGVKENTQYTITFEYSFYYDNKELYSMPSFVVVYTDGTRTIISNQAYSSKFTTISYKTDANKTLYGLKLVGFSSGATVYVKKNMQIEEGNVSTEPALYVEPTEHVADENGNVEGITSAYPTTILTSDDGVIVTAQYNRDINKAFAEMQNAILSLGGNV